VTKKILRQICKLYFRTAPKLNVNRLTLRRQQGFLCVMPSGRNVFGTQFERVLPAGSVANLHPFNYSGKTDPGGFYIGRDKFGSNIIVDFERRDDDKTNGSILILGNSDRGKSYLLKLCLCNIPESGKSVLCLDPEHEQEIAGLNSMCVGAESKFNFFAHFFFSTGGRFLCAKLQCASCQK
jgi:hypothetical protein